MLSGIFPTAYFGTDLARVGPGDTVAVLGAGPAGLLAVHSAWLRGAARVFAVDMHDDRLDIARKFGAESVSLAGGDPAEQILEASGGMGAGCGVEAVGYQAHDRPAKSARAGHGLVGQERPGRPAASAW